MSWASPRSISGSTGLTNDDGTPHTLQGREVCVSEDDNDWNVQGIAGLAWRATEKTELVLCYRMLRSGGFASEDRTHMLTAGVRVGL